MQLPKPRTTKKELISWRSTQTAKVLYVKTKKVFGEGDTLRTIVEVVFKRY